MAYSKQNFTDGQVLTAAHLNAIEQGIADVESAVPTKTSALTNDSGFLTSVPSHTHSKSQINDFPSTETWTFTLEDGSTVTKAVYIG